MGFGGSSEMRLKAPHVAVLERPVAGICASSDVEKKLLKALRKG